MVASALNNGSDVDLYPRYSMTLVGLHSHLSPKVVSCPVLHTVVSSSQLSSRCCSQLYPLIIFSSSVIVVVAVVVAVAAGALADKTGETRTKEDDAINSDVKKSQLCLCLCCQSWSCPSSRQLHVAAGNATAVCVVSCSCAHCSVH